MVQTINLLAETLGCNIDYLPTIYLGLPLGAKANSISIWDEILPKKKGVKRNHRIGKVKIFLLDGRLVLINSVLDPLSTHHVTI